MKRHILAEYLDRLTRQNLVKESNLCGLWGQEITNVTYDSRRAVKGSLFLCKGAAFRPEYLEQAQKRGAVCYVAQHRFEAAKETPYILVTNIRKAQAVLGAFHYGNPQKDLLITGITGTKGKTTTAYYLQAILDAWKGKPEDSDAGNCALISTIHTWDGKGDEPSEMTTPEALELYRHFRNAVDAGMEHLVMEVSSQALKYQRVWGLQFEVGIFLNISEDHISPQEHTDFEDYFHSKLSMFRQVKTACVNTDSQYAEKVLHAARISKKIITFGTHGTPDIFAWNLRKEGKGLSFFVRTPEHTGKIRLGMSGIFNVENALAAIAAAYAYKVPFAVIERALAGVRVEGRMEQYASRDGKITAIVDFAHNMLSFEKLYDSVLQEFRGYSIYTVFGCPGGKALNRRRELGLIAGLFSKKVFLTADDPGTEDAAAIAREIGQNMEIMDCPYTYIENRGKAIRTAVAQAAAKKEGRTVILVLGKGHETHQKFGKRSYDYPSDAVMVRKALSDYNSRSHIASIARPSIDEPSLKVYNVTWMTENQSPAYHQYMKKQGVELAEI